MPLSTPWLIALCVCAAAGAAEPRLVFVDDTAPPGGDGASWATAHADLQDALDEANGASGGIEIRIAAGVYRPDRGTGDRAMSFVVRGGVALVGGFPDGGGELAQRDAGLHETVLTGDLAGDDTAALHSRFDNSEHVVRTATDGAVTAALRGLVVERGFGTSGAGVLLDGDGGVVELIDCALRDHWAQFGAALEALGGYAPVVDARGSVFAGNTAVDGGGAVGYSVRGRFEACEFIGNRTTGEVGAGGAVAVRERASFVVCRFIDNEAAYGGAVSGMGIFEGCLFEGNRAALEGGAMAPSFGETVALRCIFRGNEAALDGGAVSGAIVSVRVLESLLVGNTAGGEGGALADNVDAVACTIVQNGAGTFGGAGIGVVLADSIVWGNTDAARAGGVARAQWAEAHTRAGGLIEGDAPAGVTADDIFMDFRGPDGLPATGDEDFRLRTGSPAIDAGAAALDALRPSTRDIRGGARFIDLDGGSRRDLGAYEAQDSDRNGVVDAEDIASGALADCDGDGAADIAAGESHLFPRIDVVTTEAMGPAPDGSARVAIARRRPLDVGVDVLARTPQGWIVEAALVGPAGSSGATGLDLHSVAGADNLAAALWALPGGVFAQVFERDAFGWGETALLGPLPGLTDSIGAVAVSEEQVFVRADAAVQVYERDGDQWTLVQTLPAGLGEVDVDPGTISHNAGVLAVAGYSAATFDPEVRIYERMAGGDWSEAPGPDIASLVSGSLWSIRAAIGGDLLAVGVAMEAARFEVFLFRRDGAGWVFEGAAPTPAGVVTLNGLATDGALVAAQGFALGASAPATLIFRRVGEAWVFEGAPDERPYAAGAGSLIGAFVDGELVQRNDGAIETPARALALGGRAAALIVGPRGHPDCAPCPADLTGDGVVDGADLGRALGAWGGSGGVDLTGDGVVDGSDVGLLLTAWGICP
jgi:hypothetical protein